MTVGASVPDLEKFGGLVDAAVVDEDAVNFTEVGVNGSIFFEDAAAFSDLGHAGAAASGAAWMARFSSRRRRATALVHCH